MMNQILAFYLNQELVDYDVFNQAACNPQQSVVIEACAGSGKTWLLVARMLRCLLQGAKPEELLAITFTKKAAEEMRSRLFDLLRDLALVEENQLIVLLKERGVVNVAAQDVHKARSLYAEVLQSPHALSIDTFHSWFGRLLSYAPLESAVPQSYTLIEKMSPIKKEAFRRLMLSLDEPKHTTLKAHYAYLLREVGAYNTKNWLDAFLMKRAEWWAINQQFNQEVNQEFNHQFDAQFIEQGVEQGVKQSSELWDANNQRLSSYQKASRALSQLLGQDGIGDARLALWSPSAHLDNFLLIAKCFALGGSSTQIKNAEALEKAITQGKQALDDIEKIQCFNDVCDVFLTQELTPRKLPSSAKFKQELPTSLRKSYDEVLSMQEELADFLNTLRLRAKDLWVSKTNEAMFALGQAYIYFYQQVKTEQNGLDFSDLEWQVYRLMQNEAIAAYLHGRLDAKYKHILLDEFQDTNPLQWEIVYAWLQAYGAEDKPSVFVVGDPKQSIYRFRRADPRVFAATRKVLKKYGAIDLQTNHTRRNAASIVSVLNAAMVDNVLFHSQTTGAMHDGQVQLLPLIEKRDKKKHDVDLALRNPLHEALPEVENVSYYNEALQVGRYLLRLKSEWEIQGKDWQWAEVMLLVRGRTHIAEYEKALRDCSIPFLSDKKGGLFQTLVISDLLALLKFLASPQDSLSLLQILKSPLFAWDDDALIKVASFAKEQQLETVTWWDKLQAYAAVNSVAFNDIVFHDVACHDSVSHDDAATNYQVPLNHAIDLLSAWLTYAHHLPTHDLLDKIIAEGCVRERYAIFSSSSEREQVLSNIEQFLILTLDVDGGRYPSLSKFIQSIQDMIKGDENESPDEAPSQSIHALKMMTIHGSKGLEAEIVVLMNANHTDAKTDKLGILCSWPLDGNEGDISTSSDVHNFENTNKHFSVFGKKDDRGFARKALFDDEEKQAEQENQNLFYVAVTRAKSYLIASGIGGATQSSWYQGLLQAGANVIEFDMQGKLETLKVEAAFSQSSTIELEVFAPKGILLIPSVKKKMDENPDLELISNEPKDEATLEMIEGTALHLLMERLTQDVVLRRYYDGDWTRDRSHKHTLPNWDNLIPNPAILSAWLPCALSVATQIRHHAIGMLSQVEWRKFFNPNEYVQARNEMEIMAKTNSETDEMTSMLLRLDRVVFFQDEIWILDYKRRVHAHQKADYSQQLNRYIQALKTVYTDIPIRAALLTYDGELLELGKF